MQATPYLQAAPSGSLGIAATLDIRRWTIHVLERVTATESIAPDDEAGGFSPGPSDRFVLVRPHGGLNDTLVQLERCRRYAVAYGRILAVDLARSGIRMPFGSVFRVRPQFGCPVVEANPGVLAALDAMNSVEPAMLQGVLASYDVAWDPVVGQVAYGEGRVISFDMTVDNAARCVVHERFGGGMRGALPLRDLALTPQIAGEVVARLARLGSDYDALHVRYTDYHTDFQRFFARVKPIFAGRRLLVCTDSAEVQRYAREFFAPDVEVVTNGNVPDLGGEALHVSSRLDPYRAVVDQFCDLIAMARARRFLFPVMNDRTPAGRRRISGFSLLVEGLRALPEITEGLVSLAPNGELVRMLPRPSLARRVRRLSAELADFVWNNPVYLRRWRVRRLVRDWGKSTAAGS